MLDLLEHKPGEPLREYVRLFDQVRCRVLDILDAALIMTFYANVRDTCLVEELAAWPVRTIAELYRLVNRCDLMEEEARHVHAPPASTAST